MKTTFSQELLFYGLCTVLVSGCLFTSEIRCGNTRTLAEITLARTLTCAQRFTLGTRLTGTSIGLWSSLLFNRPLVRRVTRV